MVYIQDMGPRDRKRTRREGLLTLVHMGKIGRQVMV